MFSNYIKLAWRVLARRKFFTFISLFGISFTLGILMTLISFLQSELGSSAPLTHIDDIVTVRQITMETSYFDTLTIVDTIIENGAAVYDTTYEYKSAGSSMSQSSFSKNIIQSYLSDIPSARKVTMFNGGSTYDLYVNGVKLSLQVMMADANYWEAFDHPMLEGRAFDENDVESEAQVIVISTLTSEKYFGRKNNVVDEEIEIDGRVYRVIGLFEHKGKIMPFVSPDAVAPYTTAGISQYEDFYFGSYRLVYLRKPGADLETLKEEIREQANIIPLDHPDNEGNFTTVKLRPATYNEMYAQGVYYQQEPEKSHSVMRWVLISLLLFFTILPTLNLINLNVSRVMDRSSEIGVRKAFGAHQGNIITQFITENIVQTILGGIIGFGIAWVLISIINNGGYLGKSILTFNFKFFLYSFIATLIFGVLSGFLPALKMSRLPIVNALKENKL